MAEDWDRLAQAVRERRIALGLSKRQAINVAGVSSTTWLKVENDGTAVEDKSWAGIARALNWDSSSVLKVLNEADRNKRE